MSKVNFTASRLAAFTCPEGKDQAFLWDAKAHGLALRVTESGSRAYVLQGRLSGRTIRLTIGDPETWTIADAQAEARRLQTLLDQGRDPRVEKAANSAKDAIARSEKKAAKLRLEVTGQMAWDVYCAERRPEWSERHHADHIRHSTAGGVKRKRGVGTTMTGTLYPVLAMPLSAISPEVMLAWATREVRHRRATACLAFRLFRAFINWCCESEDYKTLVDRTCCEGKKVREKLGKAAAKSDCLQREQLAPWFAEVRKEPNPVIAAYLQALLLTGARREELMSLRWENVDFQWNTLKIRDKVEGERTIPLTPYVGHLLSWLPRRNAWVFSSTLGQMGRLTSPGNNHQRALIAAGIPHVSLHGLRRSFGTLSEWVDLPVGVAAQIQGHKPSAIAEKHYRFRPIDLLRMWHERVEDFILEQGKVDFKKEDKTPSLRLLSAA